ncbi:MAG: hypothetical protein WC010_02240 [Candidatus Absconditabacterales bacterium]
MKFILHPTTVKTVGVICIVGFFFVLPTYAQNIQADEGLESLKEGLNNALGLFSRLWIVLAIIAGKLMTNDFVYGAFLHMDIYLWKIRNIMKNFANFTLIALILGSIVEGLIGKKAIDIKKIITNTLVAGIIIQASWFLMGAAIDVSTITTTAVSAFPMSFLKNDTSLKNNMDAAITKFKGKRIIVNTGIVPVRETAQGAIANDKQIRDNMMPTYKSVSGPFIFLGMGIFKFQNYSSIDMSKKAATVTLEFLLRFILLFFFTIGLILLVIANVIRIGLLWIFIVGSPFLVIIKLFEIKIGDGGLGKLFSIPNLLAVIFKPVIFVASISMMLIVILSMRNGMRAGGGAQRENDLNGVSLTMSGDNTSILSVGGVTSVSLDQTDLLGKGFIDAGQNAFSMIIMLLLSIFIMRGLVKLSLTIGGGPIEGVMKNLIKNVEDIAKSAPILPFKGGASLNAMKSFSTQTKNKALGGLGMSPDGNFSKAEQEFDAYVNQKFLGMQPSRTPADYDKLNTTKSGTDFMSTSRDLGVNREGGLSLGNTTRESSLQKTLGNQAYAKELGLTGSFIPESGKESAFAEYLNQKDGSGITNAFKIYNNMGGDKHADKPSSDKGLTYETLKSIRFYANEKPEATK